MPRTCSADSCTRFCWGGGYCKYHQFMRKLKGGDLYGKSKDSKLVDPQSPRKAYKIPRESETRKEQGKTYTQVKNELREELIAQGEYNCFFCTKPMYAEFQFHHLKGRDGDNFIDKRYLVPAHNQCHVYNYHPSTVEQLHRFEWYNGFLLRLKAIDESLYREELRKAEKTINLFDE